MEPLKYVVKAFMHGAEIYGDFNWKDVENAEERYNDSAQRHINDYRGDPGLVKPEWLDESGTPHLANAIASLLILFWHELKNRREP